MEWVEAEPDPRIRLPVLIDIMRSAVALHPEHADRWARLGRLLNDDNRAEEAVEAFEQSRRLDLGNFADWRSLIDNYVTSGRPQDALGLPAPENTPGLDLAQGVALLALGDTGAGHAALRRAVDHADGYSEVALHRLLNAMCSDEDGGPTLALCDGLPDCLRRCTIVRAYGAIALSRTGRADEARRLVDLERHLLRVPFTPSAEFGGIEAFNRELAATVLARPAANSSGGPSNDYRNIHYRPPNSRGPQFEALFGFIREAMARFIDEIGDRGLDDVMPPPRRAMLVNGSTVLRGDGHNGEHIHAEGYLSSVYHVLLPDGGDDDRGALVVGGCAKRTGGYQPCWGTRTLKPEAGWLTLFPSHIFHDVIPTGVDAPRVSIVADMNPAD
jgi:tetratricopeptide (TPR) repeat protein